MQLYERRIPMSPFVMNTIQFVAVFAAIVAISNFVLLALRAIDVFVFWLVTILLALIAYIVIPRMKS